ncbi:RNA polymerase sigma factor SigJ [Actinoplanes sp. TRM 88003]|uniref:RNA polymerase sigma factor SigJ n=1 Tax=Paractinoplanes aksuensis TaxID=2939490 RepID=A0ABT1E1G5_9ACTN|nr:RNA polymerase sigma factor SigJ [Actinoplanes aksuensis]MCO8276877.1 RNA polymerase sigma factor SigJ [Actinoplanes aksuensis]
MTINITDAVRRRLFAVAYRLLGSVHDAEDAVGEGVLRWQQLSEENRARVREPLAWLTRVVSRVCLDQLKSARVRRERYQGVWLPEPVLGAGGPADDSMTVDPADRVTLDDSVSYAFMVALERLSPAERVSFILHDVFGVPFDEVAETVGRSPAACRQSAVSARRHLRLERRFDVTTVDRDHVVAAFLDACRGGDLAALVKVLHPDVEAVADGGGVVHAALKPVVGSTAVAKYLLGSMRLQENNSAVPPAYAIRALNGRNGIVVSIGGHIVGTVDVSITDGVITRILMQVNPDKLHL